MYHCGCKSSFNILRKINSKFNSVSFLNGIMRNGKRCNKEISSSCTVFLFNVLPVSGTYTYIDNVEKTLTYYVNCVRR